MTNQQTKQAPKPVDWVTAAIVYNYKISIPVAKLNAWLLFAILLGCAAVVYSGAVHGDVYVYAKLYAKAAIGFRFMLVGGLLTLLACAKAVGRRTPGLFKPMITVAMVCFFTAAVLVGRCTP